MRSISAISWLTGLVLLTGCAPLGDIEPGVCGNRVVEKENGEACDGSEADGPACRGTDKSSPCRFDCSDGGSCPAGLLCGTADGVCRAPSGELELPFEIVPRGAERLYGADFDGDKWTDLVAVSEQAITIHYLEDSARLASSFETPAAPGHVIGKMSNDDLPDLAIKRDVGISVQLGRSDRSFDPTVYSTIPLPQDTERILLMDALPDSDGQELVIFRSGNNGNVSIDGTSVAEQGALKPLVSPTPGYGPIEGEVAVLHGAECDIMAFAYQSDPFIRLLSPCSDSSSWNDPQGAGSLGGLPLPLDVDPWAGVFAVDVDADEDQDLILGVQGPAGVVKQLRVAFQTDAGITAVNGELLLNVETKCSYDTPSLTGEPLAIVDLDGDGRPEIFDEYGFASVKLASGSTTELTFTREYCTENKVWRKIAVGRFNLDEYTDVAFVPANGDSVEVMIGTPSGAVNYFSYPLDSQAEDLRVGDFDGDVVDDLLVRQRVQTDTGQGGAAGGRLSVLFGRSVGGPEDPQHIGDLGSIQEIRVGYVIGGDGINDVAVVSAGDPSPTLAVLPGDGTRRLHAPFLLYSPLYDVHDPMGMTLKMPVPSLPQRIAGGDFDGDGHVDIAVIAEEQPPAPNLPAPGDPPVLTEGLKARVWRVLSSGDAVLKPESMGEYPNYRDTFDKPMSLVAVNLDAPASGPGDPDELVLFVRTVEWVDQVITLRVGDTALQPLSFEAGEPADLLYISQNDQAIDAPIQVHDLDLNDRKDIALTNWRGELVVLWNDGAITPENRLQVLLPGAGEIANLEVPIQDFTFAELDGAAPPELVYMTPTGLRAVRFTVPDGATRPTGVEEMILATDPSTGEAASVGGRAVFAFDADHDGLTDIAIAGQDGISLMRGRERSVR